MFDRVAGVPTKPNHGAHHEISGSRFQTKGWKFGTTEFFFFLNTKLISDMCFFLLLLFYRAELYFVEGEFHELYHRIFENKSNTALEGLLML